jgi:hypothetical protein
MEGLDIRIESLSEKMDVSAEKIDLRFDRLGGDIVTMRERLARIEERIGIKATAS